MTGFEPATSRPPDERATGLRYIPKLGEGEGEGEGELGEGEGEGELGEGELGEGELSVSESVLGVARLNLATLKPRILKKLSLMPCRQLLKKACITRPAYLLRCDTC